MSGETYRRPQAVAANVWGWALAAGCLTLWAVKFWLIPRLNINWDEFLYLSRIHAAGRGETAQALQTSYTHVFSWLPGVAGDEIAQVRLARVLMVSLLGASALLIQRLSMRWFSPVASWGAALAFLAMWPSLKHGGSFRADSILLPLHIGALLMLSHPGTPDRSKDLRAGMLLGVATAVSIKTVLLAPVVAIFCTCESRDWRRGLLRLARLSGASMVTAAVLIGTHLLSIAGQDPVTSAGAMVDNAWRKTLRDTPWFPQLSTLREMLGEDPITWFAALVGAVWALKTRRWLVAGCALALLPIAFYRNSFAYYYVVMWGPASIAIAAAIACVQELAAKVARPAISATATIALAVMLGAQGLRDLPFLAHPRQDAQVQLVAAVHAIFPEPVSYIDHSGMIASFPKVNFFMSTWGVESYVRRGEPFMPGIIKRFRPPLLIANRAELVPGTASFDMLLQQDREIIEYQYQSYWGPIRLAGAMAVATPLQSVVLKFPFGGTYRLASSIPAIVDGRPVAPGEVIQVMDQRLSMDVALAPGPSRASEEEVRFVWAAAGVPPDQQPVSMNFYDPL